MQTILQKVIKKKGEEHQIRKAVEELTELSLALQRSLDNREDIENINEEIADVEIMIEQVKMIKNICKLEITRIKTEKLKRLENTLNLTKA